MTDKDYEELRRYRSLSTICKIIMSFFGPMCLFGATSKFTEPKFLIFGYHPLMIFFIISLIAFIISTCMYRYYDNKCDKIMRRT